MTSGMCTNAIDRHCTYYLFYVLVWYIATFPVHDEEEMKDNVFRAESIGS